MGVKGLTDLSQCQWEKGIKLKWFLSHCDVHLQISGLINKLKDTLTAKEQELTAFKDKHNIRVKGERESQSEDSVQTADKTSGVLVAQDNS